MTKIASSAPSHYWWESSLVDVNKSSIVVLFAKCSNLVHHKKKHPDLLIYFAPLGLPLTNHMLPALSTYTWPKPVQVVHIKSNQYKLLQLDWTGKTEYLSTKKAIIVLFGNTKQRKYGNALCQLYEMQLYNSFLVTPDNKTYFWMRVLLTTVLEKTTFLQYVLLKTNFP